MKTQLASHHILILLALLLLVAAFLPLTTFAAPPQQAPTVYYVQWGDTLFSIAQRFHTTVPALMSANGLLTNYIYAGQRLTIPPSGTPLPPPANFQCKYTVQYRDTLYSIAYRYQIPYAQLMQANYMYTPYLRTGQSLNVPCSPVEPTPFPTRTVVSGDNIFRIAIEYNTSIYAIAYVNGLNSLRRIYPGQVLVIPYPGSKIWPPVPTVTPTPVVTITNTPVPTATPTPQPAGVVIMSNQAYLPFTAQIKPGSTILWQNTEDTVHTVVSGTPGAPDNKFRSPNLGLGNTFVFTFNTPGTYAYFDELHPTMTGQIIVQ